MLPVLFLFCTVFAFASDLSLKEEIQLLENGVQVDPRNHRYVFRLAEGYRSLGEPALALKWHQKRVSMGGSEEEIYWSKLQIAHMLKELGLPIEVVVEAYQAALTFRPFRLEPIYYIADLYNKETRYLAAYEILALRDILPKPDVKDMLYVENWIEEYGVLFQFSIAAYYTGHFEDSLAACDQLLAIPTLPVFYRERVELNRVYPLARVSTVLLAPR